MEANPSMMDTMVAQALMPASIETFDDYNRLRKAACASMAAFHSFAEEVDKATSQAGSTADRSMAHKLGLCQAILGRPMCAIELLGAASDSALKHFVLGRCLRGARRFAEAHKSLERAAAAGFDEKRCRLEQARVHLDEHQLDQVMALLSKTSSSKEHEADWHYLQGAVLMRRGEFPESIGHLEAALQADGEHREAMFLLAYVLDLTGADDDALRLYEHCAQTPPVHVNALINLATIYEDRGAFDRAEECLLKVLGTDPNHARAALFLKDVRSSMSMFYDEDQERVLEKRNALLDTPISDFELSVRSRNCLKKMSIDTLGDLLNITEPELLAYKNFGETSLLEIKNMLSIKGLRLGQLREQGPQKAIPTGGGYAPSGSPSVLSKPVSELELSVRARKCLQRLGINSLGELCMRTEAELLGTKNFGQTSLNEIKQRLAENGLALRRLDD